MKIHPIAEEFPLLEGADLEQLAQDIRENGQIEPIVTWNGVLIDGRNRLRACEIAGVEPRFEERLFIDEHGVVDFIISKNILRRHLNASQKAMLGEKLRPGLVKAAKERQRAGRDSGGKKTAEKHKQGSHTNSSESHKPRDWQSEAPGNVNAQIGLKVGVGPSTVFAAKVVTEQAPAEVIAKVMAGEMSLNAAHDIVKGRSKSEKKSVAPPQPIDISTLAASSQQKLDAAIRQEKRRLQMEFESAVQAELAKALDETVLPAYNRQKAEFNQVIQSRKGCMPRETYRQILSCLHPDRVLDPGEKERYTKAFHAFQGMELVLCNEKEMPTSSIAIPRTYEELMKRRAEVQASRRRKQANSKGLLRPCHN